jgi:hypothetical protein
MRRASRQPVADRIMAAGSRRLMTAAKPLIGTNAVAYRTPPGHSTTRIVCTMMSRSNSTEKFFT